MEANNLGENYGWNLYKKYHPVRATIREIKIYVFHYWHRVFEYSFTYRNSIWIFSYKKRFFYEW